jgi:hypothetical protein
MSSAAHRLRLGALRAATLDDDGRVVPLPWLSASVLSWAAADAHRVLHAWRDALAGAESPIASTARLRRPPRGAATVSVEVALPGGVAGAHRVLAPLRALDPATDDVVLAGPELLRPALTAVPPGTAPFSAHLRLAALPPAAVDAFLAVAGPGARTELLSAEVHHLGGAFAIAAVAAAVDADEAERVRVALAQLERRLAFWAQ